MKGTYSVLGIGGPILDQILPVTEEYLATIPGEKAGMEPVDYHTLQKIIENSGSKPISVPGGSSRNMINGMVRLGDACAFCGKIGNDSSGEEFIQLMKQRHIELLLARTDTPTAVVLSLVTPDGQRTFRTFLGASQEMRGQDLRPEYFNNVQLVHIEGYALYNDNLVETAMQYAQEAGAKISFDLASFEIVRKFKPKIVQLLGNYVDIVFANELEAAALTELNEEAACDFLAELCEVGIVLMGPLGCWVKRGNHKMHCPAYPVKPIDTTGAGDLFASGFLHAYLQGFNLEECAHYGAIAGRAVVQVMGAEIPHQSWAEIFALLKKSQ